MQCTCTENFSGTACIPTCLGLFRAERKTYQGFMFATKPSAREVHHQVKELPQRNLVRPGRKRSLQST